MKILAHIDWLLLLFCSIKTNDIWMVFMSMDYTNNEVFVLVKVVNV